jgi:hypothetical protein
MSEMRACYAGQTIRAAIVFANYGRGSVERVTATFVQQETEGAVIEMSSHFLRLANDYDDAWEVLFEYYISPDVTPGLYRCESVKVVYEGGREVPFVQAPDVAFRIEEERIRNPEPLSEWRWIEEEA